MVTYYDPYIDTRHAAIFVHDASGGVFKRLAPARPILSIKPGTLVDIAGVTNGGDYAAVVSSDQVRPVGQSSLPANPPKVSLTQLLTGALDCEWVAVEGRVRSAHMTQHNVVLSVAADGGMLTAVTVRQDGVNYDSLVDSLVRIDGNAAPLFNQRRQMVGVHMFFPTLSQVTVLGVAGAARSLFSACGSGHGVVPLLARSRAAPPGSRGKAAVTLELIGRAACFAFRTPKQASACRPRRLRPFPSAPWSRWSGFP